MELRQQSDLPERLRPTLLFSFGVTAASFYGSDAGHVNFVEATFNDNASTPAFSTATLAPGNWVLMSSVGGSGRRGELHRPWRVLLGFV